MAETIEAEVIEIDGAPPPPRADQAPEPGSGAEGYRQRVRGAVLRLDRRWWPLWLVLGVIAVALLLTVGVVVAVAALVLSLIRRFFGLLFGAGSPTTSRGGEIRRF